MDGLNLQWQLKNESDIEGFACSALCQTKSIFQVKNTNLIMEWDQRMCFLQPIYENGNSLDFFSFIQYIFYLLSMAANTQ